MKTTSLITAIWILTPIAIVSTMCMIRFLFDIMHLEKENEQLKERLEKHEVAALSRKLENDEVLARMFADLEREELIFMNT